MSYKNSKWNELKENKKTELIAFKVTKEQKEIWNNQVKKFGKTSKLIESIFENFK